MRSWSTFLDAKTEEQVDDVFSEIFDIVDEARHTGDFVVCESLVGWIVRDEVIGRLDIDILLSSLRLTAAIRDQIHGWHEAVRGVERELSRRERESDVDALLCGLR